MNESTERESIVTSGSIAPVGGCHEISFAAGLPDCPELPLVVSYTLPSGAIMTTRGFATADGQMKARCFVDEEGFWSWEAKNFEGRLLEAGSFKGTGSTLPGKLRISRKDPRQLRYSNGGWYLGFGDNAFRLMSTEETNWKACIDQAAQAGFNRLRVWLRPPAESLFDAGRHRLDLEAWEQIEERLLYGLRRHPELQFEISLFGENMEELKLYGDGDPAAHLRLRYAVERFAPLPNVHWAIAAVDSEDSPELAKAAAAAGAAIAENDPWNSLVSASGARFASPLLAEEKFLTILSIRSLGEITGEAVAATRSALSKPVALVEDRGEQDQAPRFPRYYFRRLFWSTLLSGGLPTYSGLDTRQPWDRNRCGIAGYYDACNSGKLRFGAHDLLNIKTFFSDTGIQLENWRPLDTMSGSNPLLVKSAISIDENECIAYIANPQFFENHDPKGIGGQPSDAISDASETFTTFTLELPFSEGTVKWFNPIKGEWRGDAQITRNSTTLLTPEPGDWVVWVKRA